MGRHEANAALVARARAEDEFIERGARQGYPMITATRMWLDDLLRFWFSRAGARASVLSEDLLDQFRIEPRDSPDDIALDTELWVERRAALWPHRDLAPVIKHRVSRVTAPGPVKTTHVVCQIEALDRQYWVLVPAERRPPLTAEQCRTCDEAGLGCEELNDEGSCTGYKPCASEEAWDGYADELCAILADEHVVDDEHLGALIASATVFAQKMRGALWTSEVARGRAEMMARAADRMVRRLAEGRQ